jgi:hypothetical protein
MVISGMYFKKAPQRPTHEEIQLEAYHLWENAGKPEGMSERFWNMAKERCNARHEIPSLASNPETEQKRKAVMEMIRSEGVKAWDNMALRNIAASVGINMDRL